MLKARAQHRDGRPLLVLGLSDENLRRLQDDLPILFDAAELGVDAHIAIIAGGTEQEMIERLRGLQ